MSDNFRRYLEKLDELRVLRAKELDQDEETDILDEMDEVWEKLTSSEREDVRDESWRAWPHQYAKEVDKRLASHALRGRSDIDTNPGKTTIMVNSRIRISAAQPAHAA